MDGLGGVMAQGGDQDMSFIDAIGNFIDAVVVVVVYHVTIVAFGHGLLKKFWPFW